MNVLKKIGSIFLDIVIVLLVLVIILNVIFISGKDDKKLPSLFGYKFLVDLTDSMKPVITPGDLIVIKSADEYKMGDIISYRNKKNEIITHRITRIVKDKNGNEVYHLKGDNNNTEDRYKVKKEEIEGKLYKHYHKIGTFLLFLKSIYGIVFLLMLVFCYMTFLIIKEKYF